MFIEEEIEEQIETEEKYVEVSESDEMRKSANSTRYGYGKPNWYIVHTYSGYEDKVKRDLEKTIKNRELEDYFFEIIVPMEEQIEIKNGERKTSLKKVFPGYVVVKMIVTEETWYIVRNTRRSYRICWKWNRTNSSYSRRNTQHGI
jgi:transcriptional antiterminator NusG